MTCAFFDPDNDVMDDSGIDNTESSSDWNLDLQIQSRIEDNLDIIESNREDIKTVNDSILSISGLLVTISTGALYFSFNKDSTIDVPLLTRLSLFFAILLLTAAIFKSISALQLKPRTTSEKEELLNELEDAHDKENNLTNSAINILKLSIGFLIAAMLFLALNNSHFFEIFYNSTLKLSSIMLAKNGTTALFIKNLILS